MNDLVHIEKEGVDCCLNPSLVTVAKFFSLAAQPFPLSAQEDCRIGIAVSGPLVSTKWSLSAFSQQVGAPHLLNLIFPKRNPLAPLNLALRAGTQRQREPDDFLVLC